MADNANYFVDSRLPFITGDISAVTLSSTDKALIPAANIPVLGTNYFGFIGKAIRIRLFGRMTTAATPGNGTFSLYYGTGADANGTVICASAAIVLTASMTSSSWELDLIVRARTLGATGTLFGTGAFNLLNSVTTTAAASEYMVPATAGAASGSVDLTSATLILSPQFKRSGSTAETMQVHDVSYEALN